MIITKIRASLRSVSILILISILALVLCSCSKKNKDELKPYRGMTADQIFNQGEHQLVKHQYKPAAKTLQALGALYPFSPYSEQAELDLIYAYYMKGDTASGLAEADRFIRLYPRSQHIDYVYYMKGLLSDQEGLTWLQHTFHVDPAEHDLNARKQAYLAFSQVVTEFPDSPYAHDSALRMTLIRNLLAHKQVKLAQFYLKRKAYVAAINRASYVVEHYNGSPEVINALAILVQAYRGMNLTQMANNTFKIMQASYPNAPLLNKLSKSN